MSNIINVKEVILYVDDQKINLSNPIIFDVTEPLIPEYEIKNFDPIKIELKITAWQWYMDIPKLIWTNVLSACNFWRN